MGATFKALEEWGEDLFDDGWGVHAPVGLFRPNRFGLHDMSGNVAEWCLERHGPYGRGNREGDGRRLEGNTANNVIRGGTFIDSFRGLRSAFRTAISPTAKMVHVGVRAVRPISD